jgi:hypothetical protein
LKTKSKFCLVKFTYEKFLLKIKISSFLAENQKEFTFLFGNKRKVRLDEIFNQLKKTQIYFGT